MSSITVDWPAFLSPIWISLKVTLIASLIVLPLGALAARAMSRRWFRGKAVLETLLILPLVLPPSVVGFILLMFLGRRSFVGELIEWVFDQPVLFTWWAAVIASVIVAFPLVYQTLSTGMESVDPGIENTARLQGANEWQVFIHITLPLIWKFVATAYTLGFARGLGEFGATLMIAGNIPGKTQTLPTAVYLAVDAGNYSMAWLWVVVIISISFLMIYLVNAGWRQRD